MSTADRPIVAGDLIRVRLLGHRKVSTITVTVPDLFGDGELGQGYVPSRQSPGDFYGGLRTFELAAVVERLSPVDEPSA